jgi:NAD-dependent deacetylase
VRAAQPNAGHRALARYAARRPRVLTVVSQNVDDLHQRAGNTDTLRLHGDILQDRWLDACRESVACTTASASPGRPPRCARCGNRVRPAVVWFGEMLPPRAIEAAERAVGRCRVLLVVGTSGAVWPAAGLAATARRAGAQVVIVNPHPSEIDDVAHEVLRGTAAQTLPRLLAMPDQAAIRSGGRDAAA